jgi:hypothetical protein
VVLHSLETLIIEESIDLQLDELRLEFERRNAKGSVVLDEIFIMYPTHSLRIVRQDYSINVQNIVPCFFDKNILFISESVIVILHRTSYIKKMPQATVFYLWIEQFKDLFYKINYSVGKIFLKVL